MKKLNRQCCLGTSIVLLITLTVLIVPSFSENPLLVTVTTDKQSYTLRENVKISGNLTYNGNPADTGLIGIQVNTPTKKLVIRTITLQGTQEEWPVDITSLYASNDAGDLQLGFERGKFAWFKVDVKNNAPVDREVLITVNVYDNNSIPIGIAAARVTITANSKVTFMPAIWIEKWVATGTATVYANVYTDWPENDGKPLCPEKYSTFVILESEYDKSLPGSTSTNAKGQNGSYELTFRHRPDIEPGIYTVIVSAWHAGWTAYSTTTFEAISISAEPWPSFVILPPVAGPGYEVKFDGTYSSPEGYGDSIVDYYWDFGDGTNATGSVVYHTFSDVGNYTVTLTVTDSDGLTNSTSKTMIIKIEHNIAITNMETINPVYNDWMVYIYVTIENKGTVPESFNVTLKVNETIVQTKKVSSLQPLKSVTLKFDWNTTGFEILKNYTLVASTEILPNETDPNDNVMVSDSIEMYLLGDVTFDRSINLFDLVTVALVYGAKEGDPNWYVFADLVRDGQINILDIVVIGMRYGLSY